jgi:phosphohistidine phosphatase
LQAGISPALVVCSPARRARETLELVSEALPDRLQVRIGEWIYGETADGLLRHLRMLPEFAASVMLVGHNPSVQELALALSGTGDALDRVRVKFPTGAMATVSSGARSWKDLDRGGGELTAFVVPRELG